MTALNAQSTVGELVAQRPSYSRVFEQLGIDFCCGGKRPLAEACRHKGLDPHTVLAMLEATGHRCDASAPDVAAMALSQLCDHIEQTHHAYLRRELPRLQRLADKVATVHGAHDPRLEELRFVIGQFAQEIHSHAAKEERILFPIIRQLEAGAGPGAFHCGAIANPIRQMEHEHDGAGNLLAQMSVLTDRFTPPPTACNTFRALFDALDELTRDMHQHVHKENNVLFPRALALEAQRRPSA